MEELLSSVCKGSSFEEISAYGSLVGVVVSSYKSLQFRSVSFFHNALCVGLFSKNLDSIFNFVNVHGLCVARGDLWDTFFNCLEIRKDNVILGGDMNFILRQVEVLGNVGRMDHLAEYLFHKLDEGGMCDVDPLVLKPVIPQISIPAL